MELRHLRYFCAVAEDGHVTRAAERLHVSQSALTQQIKALEDELGTALLRRVGRGIELTEAGAVFWHEAQSILDRVPIATFAAQEAARGLTGRLAIGMTETVSFASQLTLVMREARERWPRVEFSLIQARSNDLVLALEERLIDVALMRAPAPTTEKLRSWPFLSEGLVGAIPDTHLLATRQAITLADLTDEPLVLPHGRSGPGAMRTRIATAFARLGATAKIAQETPEYVMAINLAAAGFGIALVPAVLSGVRRDGVVYCPLAEPDLLTEIIVVARAGDPAPVLGNFVALCLEHDATKAPGAGTKAS
ncbi:LysR family transcriptional regulator [Rhizobium lusitanum]|uniref:HTH-type transcriptional regulator TtuA n=1 Tax=Rhizobium lusitanum TaxID=293958 RepID=A0A7X0IWP6_9HYPH|nr:LysR family transcriptional regulator [Rhizobium lusitanum]MBB6487111.1 DNA-binding transcriptional LysR family regulator [Rhizobium lusitanum]